MCENRLTSPRRPHIYMHTHVDLLGLRKENEPIRETSHTEAEFYGSTR